MAHHGKLSGSPFHVENIFYKHAIEHESDDCNFLTQKPCCEFFKLSGNICTLCNSGFQYCAPYKCKYLQNNLRRDTTCDACAYYFSNKCYHKKVQDQQVDNVLAATYCCYFNNDPAIIKNVQNQLRIALLKQQIESAEDKIKKSKKYIKEAEYEISLSKTSIEDQLYLRNKIISRRKRIQEFEEILVTLERNLKQAEVASCSKSPQDP